MGRRKRKISNSSFEVHLDPVSRQKVENVFEKKFVYEKSINEKWKLPLDLDTDCENWEINELIAMKSDLNILKDQLSDKDIGKWHQHTTFMNLAGNINAELRQTVRPELCTQAWCKFYEILSSYSILGEDMETLNSVHLCEAPGAFITSLNHFINLNNKAGSWNWFGSTLNPYYEGNSQSEMIDDDRFLKGTFSRWDFGVDDTGDLMSWQNLKQIRRRAQAMGTIKLVTADGSIDCQGNPAEQERVVSKLHYCEALAAVLILSPGGNLVLKKFTMFECDTVCLLYLFNCLFEEVSVFKPATSKSGNSEVYLVCIGFKGLGERKEQIEKLCKKIFDSDSDYRTVPVLFNKEDLPPDFLIQHTECCQFFTALQQETIETNLIYYGNMSEEFLAHICSMKDYCTEIYFNKYKVRSIPGYCKLTVPQKQKKQLFVTKDMKKTVGTFNDRMRVKSLPWQQKVSQYGTYQTSCDHIEWFEKNEKLNEEQVKDWSCVTGKAVIGIKSSRFCDNKLIEQQQEIKRQECSSADGLNNITADSLDKILSEVSPLHPLSLLIMSTAKADFGELELKEYIDKVTIVSKIEDIQDGGNVLVAMATGIETDIKCQQQLLKNLLKILNVLMIGRTVLLQFTPILTRFTAGVTYILASCFEKIGVLPLPAYDNQMLICYKYTGLSPFLVDHFQKMTKNHGNSTKDHSVLEIVPILTLLEDVEFIEFLTKTNENLLKSFITTAVQRIKDKLPDQT